MVAPVVEMPRGACAIVLAGGRGTRLGPLGERTPKPLLPVAGRPFVEWSIALLARAGIRRFVISLGHQAGVAEAYFRRRPDDGLALSLVVEPEPLGTAGACALAAERCPDAEAVLVTNGDSLVAAPLTDLWRGLRADVDGLLVATEVPDASRYGRLDVAPDGLLRALREKSGGSGTINAGVYVFKRPLLERLPAQRPLSFETDLFPTWLESGARFRVHKVAAPFIDIGLPETLRAADRFISTHVVPVLAA